MSCAELAVMVHAAVIRTHPGADDIEMAVHVAKWMHHHFRLFERQ